MQRDGTSAAVGTTEQSPGRFEFSTDPIQPAERFDYYCETARLSYLGFDVSSRGSGDFRGRMRGLAAGDAVITHTTLSPVSFTRTRRSILDHDDSVILMQTRRGRGRIQQAGKELPLTAGAFALYVSSMPSLIELVEPTVRASIKLPRAMVETLLRPGQMIGPALFHPDDPVMTMLAGYVGSYVRAVDAISDAAGQIAGRHMAELLALAFGVGRDAQAEIDDGGLKAARIDAILKAISERFASPYLSPAAVGSSLEISERHVHRLLENTNRTFYEHLLEARLSCAYQRLTDPRATGKSIAEVAAVSGFINVSYFNRVFRQRFGDTPSGVRSAEGPPTN